MRSPFPACLQARSGFGFPTLLSVLALLLVSSWTALAHKPSDSYLRFDVEKGKVVGQWDIAVRDLDVAIGIDTNRDGNLTWQELQDHHPAIAEYALKHLVVKAGEAGELRFKVTEQGLEQHADGAYSVLRFEAVWPAVPEWLEVGYDLFFDLDPLHRGLATLVQGEKGQTAVFSPASAVQRFLLESPSLTRQLGAFISEGVWHIWVGYDHLLFLLALLLPSVIRREGAGMVAVDSFRPALISVVKVVTAFTVAHSMTLSLGAFHWIDAYAPLVESVIAASVVLAALNNLFFWVEERGWWVAFGFGLIHGFGFANVLGELGLSGGLLVVALGGFNIGVELGQLAVVILFVPMAFLLRASWFYQRMVFQAGSLGIAIAGTLWMTERLLVLRDRGF